MALTDAAVFCTQPVDLPAEIPEAESDSDSGVGSPMDEAVPDATAAASQAEEGKSSFVEDVNTWEGNVPYMNSLIPACTVFVDEEPQGLLLCAIY